MKMKKGMLALLVLGCIGAGAMTAQAIDSVKSGDSKTLTVTTNNGVVTVTPVTGDVGEKNTNLVTGSHVYNYLHSTTVELGMDSSAAGYFSVAAGYGSTAEGDCSIALGAMTNAKGYATAVGMYSAASGEYALAAGLNNMASGKSATAVGASNTASEEASVALGYGNTSSGKAATAVGVQSIAAGEKSTAMGYGSYANAEGATAIGYQAVSTEKGTVSFGHKSGEATGTYTVTYKSADDSKMVTITTTTEYKVGDKFSDGSEVTACEANTYDSDSFARLTNVAEGFNDNDAVNFSQIKTEVGKIIKASTKEDGTLDAEGTVGKNLKALDDAIVDNKTYSLNDDKKTITVKNNAGNTAFTLNLDGISGGAGATYTAGDNVEISDDNVISVKADGKIEAGNEGIVTGGEVYDHLSGMKSDLEGQINKVGAGAAALAMLHSETFDPANKWNFAVGYGHYKNANAGALGAFYKPNADTTVTVASTMGNGNSMFGAGVSFKLGQRGQNFAPNASNAELAAEVNRLRAENEQIKAQMAEILRKLSLSENVNKSAR